MTGVPGRPGVFGEGLGPDPSQPVSAPGGWSAIGGHNLGIVSTGPHAVNTLFQLPEGGLASPESVACAPGLFGLGPARHGLFVGRDAELRELATALVAGAGVITQAVTGLGGVGKSTLADRYARANRDRFNPVWWITADGPDQIEAGLAALAGRLYPLLAVAPAELAAAWARGWLAVHTGWLLVLDNVTNPLHVAEMLGALPAGLFLLTSRQATGWHGIAEPLCLDVLEPDEAAALLAAITGRSPDEPGAAALCEELGFLPLAVEQAGAYIEQTRITPAGYLELLNEDRAGTFRRGAVGADPQRTIARIWQITLDRLNDEPLAGQVLRVLAWYAPQNIPRALLEPLAERPALVSAVGRLAAYSMITLGTDSIAVHRLVQAVARTPDPDDAHRTQESLDAARDQAIETLNAALPDHQDPASWSTWQELLPHIEALAASTDPQTDTATIAGLLDQAAVFLSGQGITARAAGHLRRALTERLRVLGPDHPDTLASRNNLASTYALAGEPGQAIPLFEQALFDFLRIRGRNHPDTLTCWNNLAFAQLSAGHLALAVSLYEQSLAERLQVLGPDHPHTLASRNGLAQAYSSTGDFGRAVALHQQNLADSIRVLGPDHLDTLTSRNSLASAYSSTGTLDRAVPLYEQNLADSTRILGPDHPNTLISRNNLASAYSSTGAVDRAVPLLKQTLADSARILGPDHPNTLASRHNLAHAYSLAGNPAQAIQLHQENLAKRIRVLGADHPVTLASQHNLASTYASAGDPARAIPLYEEALAKRIRVLGADHPDTLTSLDGLAYAYASAGDPAPAISLLEQVMAGRLQVLGPDHPDTLASRHNLAYTYVAVGNPARAIQLLEQAIAESVRVLGTDHPNTLTTRNGLAHTYASAGDLARAIPLHQENLAERIRVLGADHPDTLTSQNNLAHAYASAGDLAQAMPLHEQTLTERIRVLGADHPQTLTSRNNVASAHYAAGDLARAISLYEQTLADSVRVLGAGHPFTETVRGNLTALRGR